MAQTMKGLSSEAGQMAGRCSTQLPDSVEPSVDYAPTTHGMVEEQTTSSAVCFANEDAKEKGSHFNGAGEGIATAPADEPSLQSAEPANATADSICKSSDNHEIQQQVSVSASGDSCCYLGDVVSNNDGSSRSTDDANSPAIEQDNKAPFLGNHQLKTASDSDNKLRRRSEFKNVDGGDCHAKSEVENENGSPSSIGGKHSLTKHVDQSSETCSASLSEPFPSNKVVADEEAPVIPSNSPTKDYAQREEVTQRNSTNGGFPVANENGAANTSVAIIQIATACQSNSSDTKPFKLPPINTTLGNNDASAGKHLYNKLKSPSAAMSPLSSTSSSYSATAGYDKTKLNERLRHRLAKRNQMIRDGTLTEKTTLSPIRLKRVDDEDDTSTNQHNSSAPRVLSDPELFSDTSAENNDTPTSADILYKYGMTANECTVIPDTVSFGCEGEVKRHSPVRSYRKSISEVGPSSPIMSRSAHSKLTRQHHRGIGILQADGIVFDDALLLRLSRQARYNRLRGELSTNAKDETPESPGSVGERRFNNVKIHVYDLLTKDALVEMPLFNCHFPLGKCLNAMNNAANCMGTGAYHVGVEVRALSITILSPFLTV